MYEYLAGRAACQEQIDEWIAFFHANGFLSLDGKPLTNIRLNVLAFTVNYYLTDVLATENDNY